MQCCWNVISVQLLPWQCIRFMTHIQQTTKETMILKEYKDVGSRSINTSEAYSKVFFIGLGCAVVPYINVCLMPENPINRIHSFAEYSYFVFGDIGSIVFNAEETLNIEFDNVNKISSFEEYISLDGSQNSNGAEVKILCNGMSLFLSSNTRISLQANSFIPIDTPNYNRNMNIHEVEKFFSKENLPQEIKSVLGLNFQMISLGSI